jgi:hypothetical protein
VLPELLLVWWLPYGAHIVLGKDSPYSRTTYTIRKGKRRRKIGQRKGVRDTVLGRVVRKWLF